MQDVVARPDTHEMVVVHRVFRREYGLAPDMVAAVGAGDTERAGLVAAHLVEMGEMLHHHHSGEDDLVWPKLQERVQLSRDLVARMEAQHERVAGLLHRADELVASWRTSADASARDELAGVLRELHLALDEHLTEEEREILPLIEQHFSVEEWEELGARGRAGIAPERMLVMLGHILEDASEQERVEFLGKMPPPAQDAYAQLGRPAWEAEVALLRRDIVVPQQRQG